MPTGKVVPFRVEVPVEVLADLRARLQQYAFSRRGSRHRIKCPGSISRT